MLNVLLFTKDFYTGAESLVCCTKNTKVKEYNAGSLCLGWVGNHTIAIHHWYGKKNPSTHLPFNPSVMRLGAYRFYELGGGGACCVDRGKKLPEGARFHQKDLFSHSPRCENIADGSEHWMTPEG
jgi:hypothetical protein